MESMIDLLKRMARLELVLPIKSVQKYASKIFQFL